MVSAYSIPYAVVSPVHPGLLYSSGRRGPYTP
jgi:hypothetical protein